jgi:hypothetical protein
MNTNEESREDAKPQSFDLEIFRFPFAFLAALREKKIFAFIRSGVRFIGQENIKEIFYVT